MYGKIVGSGIAATGVVNLVPESNWVQGPVTVFVHATAAATIRFLGQGQSVELANTHTIALPASDTYHRFDVNYEAMEVVTGSVDWYAVTCQ